MFFKTTTKYPIILQHGLGNKLNFIFNTLNLPNVEYYWLNNYECMANHDDLFDFSKCGIKIHSISHQEAKKIQNPYSLKGFFYFQGFNDERLNLAKQFLKKLQPSEILKKNFNLKRKFKHGYAVRLLHSKSKTNAGPVVVPYDSFLSSDSALQRKLNPWSIQNGIGGGSFDLDIKVRNLSAQILAAADWFSLLNCEYIYTYGTEPTKTRKLGKSTFIDAAMILNKKAKNINSTAIRLKT
jgi:hypothetical protein